MIAPSQSYTFCQQVNSLWALSFESIPKSHAFFFAQWDTLLLQDDILYRKFYHSDGSSFLQIVLPVALRQPFVERLHADLGHIGQTKTALAFSNRIYFPGWRSYVRLCVRNCTVCNLHQRRHNIAKQAPLQPMTELQPMSVLHADLIGPLPVGKNFRGQGGFQYILSVVDSATRYMWLVPIRRKMQLRLQSQFSKK